MPKAPRVWSLTTSCRATCSFSLNYSWKTPVRHKLLIRMLFRAWDCPIQFRASRWKCPGEPLLWPVIWKVSPSCSRRKSRLAILILTKSSLRMSFWHRSSRTSRDSCACKSKKRNEISSVQARTRWLCEQTLLLRPPSITRLSLSECSQLSHLQIQYFKITLLTNTWQVVVLMVPIHYDIELWPLCIGK